MNKITRVIVLGHVDVSKSTFISVMKNNVLDDGRGSARNMIMKLRHERETGRTTNVTFNTFRIKERLVSLIDLAGHEKYFGNTLSGITNTFPNYAILLIGANKGVTKITRDHFTILMYLKMPTIILITKMDMTPESEYKKTVEEVKTLIMKFKQFKRVLYGIKNEEEYKKYVELGLIEKMNTVIPMINISNKTGHNLEIIKDIIGELCKSERKEKFNEVRGFEEKRDSIFYIDNNYMVRGVGLIFSGLLRGKDIELSKNEKYYIGPINGTFMQIKIKSIHNYEKESIGKLENNENGCVSVSFIKDKIQINRKKLKRGIIIVNSENYEKYLTMRFKANIYVFTHATSIKENYQSVIHCNNLKKPAKIIEIREKSCLRSNDKGEVIMEFLSEPGYIELGSLFFFREGLTKGIGKVVELIS